MYLPHVLYTCDRYIYLMHVSGLSAKEVKFPYLGDLSKQHRKVRRGGISTWERDTNFHQKKTEKQKILLCYLCQRVKAASRVPVHTWELLHFYW